MKPRCANQRNHALTLIEVLVIVFILAIMVVIILPQLTIAKRHPSKGDWCQVNVKEIAIAFQIWAGDNNDKYPMEVSITNGGAMELATVENFTSIFQVMSNELSTPKVLICPVDQEHIAATNFSSGFTKKNISYFVGLDSKNGDPQGILSGDDNFEIRGVPVKSSLLEISSNSPIAWSSTRHKFSGNIGFANCSVQSLSNVGLTNWLNQTGFATTRLVIP